MGDHNIETSSQDVKRAVLIDTPPQCGVCCMQHREARHDILVAPGPVVVRYCQRHRHIPAVIGRGKIWIEEVSSWTVQSLMGSHVASGVAQQLVTCYSWSCCTQWL